MKRILLIRVVLLALLTSILTPTVASAVEQRLVDVVSVSWVGAEAIDGPFKDVVQSIDNKVGPQWLSFTSLSGDTRDKKILFSLGKDLPNPIMLSTAMPCSGYQSVNFMGDVRDEAYRRLRITNFADRYLVIVAPKAGCIWQGKAMLGKPGEKGGVLTLHNTASSFVIVHELGHSLGLGHSNLLRCDSGARDGNWGRDCKAIEYGGSIDVMGNVETTSPLSIYHQWRLGLLENQEIKQSWKSEEVELRPGSTYGGTRAVFIKDGTAAYWLEYRKARAEDTYKSGLVIYRTDPPPVSAVVSPNPEDGLGAEPDTSVTADMWMLNLGEYRFSSGRASGSMTLQPSNSVVLASGNVEISIKSVTEDSLKIDIKRKPDLVAPIAPKITPPLGWRSPSSYVIESGFDDRESSIDFFEIDLDGVVSRVSSGSTTSWTPSYLYPLTPSKSLVAGDLPEGDYNLRVRAVDLWGNVSPWSNPEKVTIDRGFPIVSSEARVVSAAGEILQVEWGGAKDSGVGLCETNRTTEEGWVLTQSKNKSNPIIAVPNGKSLTSNFQVVDCRGNALTGKLSTKSSFVSASSARRTGKWEEVKSAFSGSMRCIGRCTITTSAKGSLSIIAGAGAAEVLVSSKKVGSFSPSTAETSRTGISLELGKSNKVVRIQGRNFSIHGFIGLDFQTSEVKQINLFDRAIDDSLKDSTQKELSNFGFSSDDFDATWNVLPMARGTTLLDPTLDLCEYEYASDKDRSARRQVTASKVGSPYIFLSTETVRYKSSVEAKVALAELKSNLQKCISDGGGLNRTGAKTVYQFSPNQIPRVQGMVGDSNGVFVHAIIGTGAQARALLGFYQFEGDLFSGLYVVANKASFFSQAQVDHWADVAATMGKRLLGRS